MSILWTNLAEKISSPAVEISFPVGYVIGLGHLSPLSIWQTKCEKRFVYYVDETILYNHSKFPYGYRTLSFSSCWEHANLFMQAKND